MLSACSTAQTEATAEKLQQKPPPRLRLKLQPKPRSRLRLKLQQKPLLKPQPKPRSGYNRSHNRSSRRRRPSALPGGQLCRDHQTVTTSAGTVEVTYRLYEHIPYVANPVDVEYQSLDVKVPVMIDGREIDATNADRCHRRRRLYVRQQRQRRFGRRHGRRRCRWRRHDRHAARGHDRQSAWRRCALAAATIVASAAVLTALAAGYVVVEPGTA